MADNPGSYTDATIDTSSGEPEDAPGVAPQFVPESLVQDQAKTNFTSTTDRTTRCLWTNKDSVKMYAMGLKMLTLFLTKNLVIDVSRL